MQRPHRYILGAGLMTALSLAMLLPDALSRGGLLSWLLIAIVITYPLASIAEAASSRRSGQHEIADALVRWTFELTTAITLVVWFDSYWVDDAREAACADELR